MISWTAQRLPSGSAKNVNRPHGNVLDLAGVDAVRDEVRPGRRPRRRRRPACPTTLPGSAGVTPTPIAIEQAEPARGQLDEAELRADLVVVVEVEADLVP